MYLEHFGLKELPFSIAPDPRYLYMSEGHREALAHLLYGMDSDGGFVLLTGEVGTGKTTLCRCLLEKIPQDSEIAFILHPTLSAAELLAAVCDEFRIVYPEGTTSVKIFVDRINAYLLEAHASGKRPVLIIEEAQNLSPEVIEQLRLLTNLETSRRKLLQIILLGQPQLRDMLARPDLLQVAQRITARYHLGPLTKAEVGSYVSHRLSVAGCSRQLFPPSVTAGIFRLSGGIPRVINVLCDRALLGAYVEGRDVVEKKTLHEAAREVLGTGSKTIRPPVSWLAAAGIFLIGAAVLLVTSHYRHALPALQEKVSPLTETQKKAAQTAWQRNSEYFPLLSLVSPYRRATMREDDAALNSLRLAPSGGVGLRGSEPLPPAGSGETKEAERLQAGDSQGDAAAGSMEGATGALAKGAENVLHP
jgi:general secretion pathway protein A